MTGSPKVQPRGLIAAVSALAISLLAQPLAAQVFVRDAMPYPADRLAFRQMPALFPSAPVARAGVPAPLEQGSSIDVAGLSFMDGEGRQTTGGAYLARENVDALIVLHRGKVVFETYAAGMKAGDPHIWQSMTASLTGLIAEVLASEGSVDLKRTAGDYAPEIAETVWGRATLRNLLDMQLNIEESAAFAAAPPTEAAGAADFLTSLKEPGVKQAGENGKVWYYTSNAPLAVGVALERATGKRWAELVHDIVWSKIGAEADASMFVDQAGRASAGGGFSSTLRDAARFADMIAAGGKAGETQVVPEAVIATLRKNAGNAGLTKRGNVALPVQRSILSFRSYWYQANDGTGAVEGLGEFGQHIYANPNDRIAIVQFGSYGHPGVSPMNWTRLTEAIVAKLTESASARR
ncbi:MAG: serine hydrolase [Rhodoblastus sp.]